VITQTVTTSFKYQSATAGQNLASDTLKLALYTANANLTASTTAYTTSSEVVGTGYTAGGKTLTNVTVNYDSSNGVVYISFDNLIWTPASFTCRGALIYNTTRANASIAILNFGSDKTCTTSFQITLPTNTSTSALLRLT
jgi:hypothetical protein